jgi:hypothetical protein
MRYPTLIEQEHSRQIVDAFGGYNHNLRIGAGEFYDMENLTSTYYPVMAPRGRRGTYAKPDSAQGLIAKDTLCYVDGQYFVMDEYRVDMNLSTAEEDCPKTMVSMGAYVIILPDKKYINTADLTDFGNIEAEKKTEANVTFTLSRMDGGDYSPEFVQSSAPESPTNMMLWVDTSSTPHVLKQWSETNGMWVSIATTYIKISSPGIGAAFEQYDGIKISGLKDTQLISANTGNVIENVSELAALEGTAVIWAKSDDYIVIVGMLDNTWSITNSITISRTMPNMDFVIESENRLWGCRYGIAENGEVVNEIYACKLGDFKNWNCFMGVSTDSYAANVGTDGRFTGAITHLGYPLFFKERFMHKVYGNYPANYQIQTTACRGVQRGCEGSLAIVNEVLYYKARQAVCAYDGSLPVEISSQLGETLYSEAVAAGHGNKYYISMKDTGGAYHLFVYDTAKGMWHREDSEKVKAFCSCRDEMYFINEAGNIRTMFGTGELDKEPVRWMATTGDIGVDLPDQKYISRVLFRMKLEKGTKVWFYISYDSDEEKKLLFTMEGKGLQSFTVPVRPRRCDHFRLTIEGKGSGRIYSYTKTIEQGSDTV